MGRLFSRPMPDWSDGNAVAEFAAAVGTPLADQLTVAGEDDGLGRIRRHVYRDLPAAVIVERLADDVSRHGEIVASGARRDTRRPAHRRAITLVVAPRLLVPIGGISPGCAPPSIGWLRSLCRADAARDSGTSIVLAPAWSSRQGLEGLAVATLIHQAEFTVNDVEWQVTARQVRSALMPDAASFAVSDHGCVGMLCGTQWPPVQMRLERWDVRPPEPTDDWEDLDELPWQTVDGGGPVVAVGWDEPADFRRSCVRS